MLPKSDGVAVVVEAVVVLAAAEIPLAAGVPVLGAAVVTAEAAVVAAGVVPNRLEGFGAAEVVLLVAGIPNWDFGGSVVVVPVVGLFAFPKSELVCIEAAGAEVPGV